MWKGWCEEDPCLYCLLKPGDVLSLYLHVQKLEYNKGLCKQSEKWGAVAESPLKKKAGSLEVEPIFCTRGEQVLEPDGRGCFSVGKCSLYRCSSDITGHQGGQGTGWNKSGQRSFTETDGPSLRELKYLPQQENRFNTAPGEFSQQKNKKIDVGVFLLGQASFLFVLSPSKLCPLAKINYNSVSCKTYWWSLSIQWRIRSVDCKSYR